MSHNLEKSFEKAKKYFKVNQTRLFDANNYR